MVKEYIDKIVENGKNEDMQELSYMLQDVLQDLKKYDENCYKKYKMKLYELAYGKVLTEKMAEKIVMNMKPDMQHWSMEETTAVKNQYGLNSIRDIDFYVVMNMAYNDYKEVLGDNVEMYVKYTKAFIMDEDAKDGKVYTYFMTIPK